MKYILRKAVIEPVPEVEISAQFFSELKFARHVLTNAFEIEQKYEIVISNFIDLEKQLIDISVTNSIRLKHSYDDSFETLSILNIRLVNLLTSTRLYLDQLPQHIKLCHLEDEGVEDRIKSRCSEEFDKFFEYRFMEALRNYVQHRGTPIHLISPKARWTSFEKEGLLEFSLQIAAQRSYLEEDGKFKKKILEEAPEKIDLVKMARQYVESISSINEFVRELINEPTKSARTTIESAHQQYSETYLESLVGLTAQQIKNDKIITSIPLLLNWDDVRLNLQKRNQHLGNLSKRYLTSK